MDVSKNSGFSPQIIHFNRVFHHKPSILGYLYFWKHPYEYMKLKRCCGLDFWMFDVFSRMRSEGFPFIVGVWGWTCVRVAFVVSSSPRRRVVVASSSPTRRQLVNSLPLGGTFALRHHPVFQSMKSRGSLARNACFGAPKSQNVRSFSCFG